MVTYDLGCPQQLFQVERRPCCSLVCFGWSLSPPTVPIIFPFLSKREKRGACKSTSAFTWFRAAAFPHKDVIEGNVRGRPSASTSHREGHLFPEDTDGIRGSWPAQTVSRHSLRFCQQARDSACVQKGHHAHLPSPVDLCHKAAVPPGCPLCLIQAEHPHLRFLFLLLFLLHVSGQGSYGEQPTEQKSPEPEGCICPLPYLWGRAMPVLPVGAGTEPRS